MSAGALGLGCVKSSKEAAVVRVDLVLALSLFFLNNLAVPSLN